MNITKILVDTDIGPDCDDTAAIAMLNIYSNQGKCEILGIAHCTSNPYGAGTIDAICRYYGNDNIVISTCSRENFLNDDKCKIYNKYITENFDNRYKTAQPESSLKMYRRILSEQPDKSVEIIAIGPLNNLSELLNSRADEYSEMTGVELVHQKVNRLVAMAGVFNLPSAETNEEFKKLIGEDISEFVEYNVACDIEAARNVASNWHTPKIYLGFEAGLIETGLSLKKKENTENPVKLAYKLYTEHGLRYSWDLMTVEFAIENESKHYVLSEYGRVNFDELGHTIWQTDNEGLDRYVIWAEGKDKISEDIEQTLLLR